MGEEEGVEEGLAPVHLGGGGGGRCPRPEGCGSAADSCMREVGVGGLSSPLQSCCRAELLRLLLATRLRVAQVSGRWEALAARRGGCGLSLSASPLAASPAPVRQAARACSDRDHCFPRRLFGVFSGLA